MQAANELHEEGDKVQFGSLTGKALSFWLEFIKKPVKKFLFTNEN